jgi:hypothetical protein
MTSKLNFKKKVITFLDSSQNFLQDRPIQFLSYLGYFASEIKIFKKPSKTLFFRHFLNIFLHVGRNDKKLGSQPLSAHLKKKKTFRIVLWGVFDNNFKSKKCPPPNFFLNGFKNQFPQHLERLLDETELGLEEEESALCIININQTCNAAVADQHSTEKTRYSAEPCLKVHHGTTCLHAL